MSYSLSPVLNIPTFNDNLGNPLNGGKIYTYVAGSSTTLQTTFADNQGVVPNTNPIVLDSSGRLDTMIWLTEGNYYRLVVTDSDDTPLSTFDYVIGLNPGTVPSVIMVESHQATQGQTVVSLINSYSVGSNSIEVSINGAIQIGGVDYTETSPTSITMTTGLNLNDVVYIRIFNTLPAAFTTASAVSYAGGTTVQAALDTINKKSIVSVTDFGAVGDGVTDDTAAIQAAINSLGNASSTAQGEVYFPRGTYKITDALVLPFEVSVKGESGRSSRIYQYGTGKDIFTWSQTIPSFSRQVSITDLWLKGPGVTNGGTPSAININHPWGIDSLTLKRLWIEEFNGWGIRTNQPASGATKNCVQFSDWDSIYIRNCNVGIVLGYGFTGESSFSNLTAQFCTTSCIDFTINPALTGPQGINIVNFSGGWSPYGVRFTAGTAGNIKFDMLHLETCSTAAVSIDSASVQKVVFDTPWFAKCPSAIQGSAGGQIDILSPQFQGAGNATDTFIKLTASSNFAVNITGLPLIQPPVSGSAPTNHISVPDMSVVNGKVQRKSATTGTLNTSFTKTPFVQTRGIMGETATVVPQNLSGIVAIANGATSVNVTLSRTEADILYQVVASVDAGAATTPVYAPGIMIGNKTTTGFTAYFSSAAPSGGYALNWIMAR